MAKYNDQIREKAVELIEDEYFSVSQVCKALGISRQAFYNWMDEKEDFERSVNEAFSRRAETLLSLAYSSAKKRLQEGKTVIEKDTYVPDERNPENLKLKSRVVIRKDYQPDLRTIKMILERNDKLEKKKDKVTPLPFVEREIGPEENEEQLPVQEKEWEEEILENIASCNLIKENGTVQPKESAVGQNSAKPKKMTARDIKKCVKIVKF